MRHDAPTTRPDMRHDAPRTRPEMATDESPTDETDPDSSETSWVSIRERGIATPSFAACASAEYYQASLSSSALNLR